jgi:hypothetical protein
MKRTTTIIVVWLGLVILAGVARVMPGIGPLAAQQILSPAGNKTISYDVAADGRTFVNVPERAGVSFGSGKLFPAGTLPSGTAGNDPTQPVNGVAPIGDWTTQGQSAFPFPPAVAPFYSSSPDFFAAQYYILEGGRTALITAGYAYFQGQNPLGALFALTGGVGAFSGAAGHAEGTPLGMNATGAPNFRITFHIQPGSVRGAPAK